MVSSAMAHVYIKMRHNWTVALLALRRNKKGEEVLEALHVQPPIKCHADSIADSIQTEHDKMLAKFPDAICGAWLAVPRHEYISSVIIHKLLSDVDAWNLYN